MAKRLSIRFFCIAILLVTSAMFSGCATIGNWMPVAGGSCTTGGT